MEMLPWIGQFVESPTGPDTTNKLYPDYARHVGRDAMFWAWPLINLYSRRLVYSKVPEIGISGPVVAAPLNYSGMLTDYIDPSERIVACPNQDVVYGIGCLALDLSAVVIQVPDFGDRFWVYQVVDLRTDGFAELGKMYGTTPGNYLLVGPDWEGEVPQGITDVFRSPTNTGIVVPRVFRDDTAEDLAAVQKPVSQIMMYPIADFDGTMKSKDWSKLPVFPSPSAGDEEVKWVVPEKFLEVMPLVLADAKPLPGEEARYAELAAVLDAAEHDKTIAAAVIEGAIEANRDLVTPLFQFRNYGRQLPGNWSTMINGASFGTDYYGRTAAAKANIFVNKPKETRYFYQDLGVSGGRLNGANSYTVTFLKGQVPPVSGFGL